MTQPTDLAASEHRAAAIVSRFTPSSNGSSKVAAGSATRSVDAAGPRPAQNSERPPWRVFRFALAFAALLLAAYGVTIKSYTLLTIEALIGTATLSVGGLLGFLFGIPRTTRMRTADSSGTDDTRRDAASTPYEPSNNLEQVADWLTKILVGVGLVELGTLGGALAKVGDQVAKALTPTPTGAAVVTEVIVITFATIGFLASFLWTRIYYGGIQARADSDIVNWVASKLEDQETRIDRADKVAQKLASGKLIPGGAAPIAAPVMMTATATPPTGSVVVTAEQAMPTGEMEAVLPDLPTDLKQRIDRFLVAGVGSDDDTVVDVFGEHPSTDNGRSLTAEITAQYEKALVIRLVVERHDGPAMGENVIFLLHPTFRSRVRVIPVEGDDRADLEIYCTGWFTVGAIADDGQTMLEYDLRKLPDAPDWFKKG
ncbi:MAG: pYEATS domain-containing protein [Deltaproteobacteria bacterium]